MATAPTEFMSVSELNASEVNARGLSSSALTAQPSNTNGSSFVDRRSKDDTSTGFERRQFGNSHATLSPDARELAEAIDAYKVEHRRRYITFEEMLKVIQSLGYRKQ